MNMVKLNPFRTYLALGYSRLVPIIPPDAEISPTSSLHRAIGKPSDPRGKAVGVKRRDGLWSGFDWLPYEADEDDLERWNRMSAGVGIKTGLQPDGTTLIGIDADTLDADHARTIRDIVEDTLGRLPVRVGRYPKALYPCRVSAPYRYTRVEFGPRNDKGNLTDRVEVLSDGRQFVAHGIHPATKAPYDWPRDVTAFADLPVFTPEQIDALMARLQQALPSAAEIVREGGTTETSQEALRGPLEAVRKAVDATPNTSALFPTREAYRDYGYAIKAALPDDPEDALDIFQDWCARWTDGTNDPDVVNSDWRRMKPPFRRGASWLYDLAEQHGDGRFSIAELWFDDVDANPIELNPFETAAAREAKREQQDVYPLLSVGQLFDRPPPTWLVGRHIPQKSVGFIYSEPGAGKSFIALDMALSIACGLPQWHGDDITPAVPDPVVVYIASEGAFDLGDRIAAWFNRRGVSRDQAKSFFVLETTVNFMSQDDVGKLLRTLRGVVTGPERRPALVVVDTVSRALPGADENLQKDMTRFVQACDAVRDAFDCAVVGIHHAGKAGDMRGSTVLLGAGDFVFRLSRKKGATVGELWCEKQKAAPDGWSEHYRLEPATLAGGRSSLVIERAETGVGARVALTPDVASAVLSAMRSAWDSGDPWSLAPQAALERRAVRRMVLDHGFDAVKADELLALWVQTGVIASVITDNRSKRKGLQVVGGHGQTVQNDDIFA